MGGATGNAIGTFEQVVALEPQHDALLRGLRALALELHPDLVEVSRPGDKAVSWGVGPEEDEGGLCVRAALQGSCKSRLYRGADLDDPTGKLRGTGKAMRHLPVTRLEQLQDPAVRALIVAARVERQRALER